MKAFVLHDAISNADQLLSYAIENERKFNPINVAICESGKRNVAGHPDYGGSQMYDRDLIEFKELLLARIDELHPHIIKTLGLSRSRVRRYVLHLAAMGNGDAMNPHTDSGGPNGPDIAYSFLLYLHTTPKKFAGGKFLIHWPDGIEVIEPRHNLLVAFPGNAIHSVELVSCQSTHFADCRFVLAGRAYLRRTFQQFIRAALNKGARVILRWLREGVSQITTQSRRSTNSM